MAKRWRSRQAELSLLNTAFSIEQLLPFEQAQKTYRDKKRSPCFIHKTAVRLFEQISNLINVTDFAAISLSEFNKQRLLSDCKRATTLAASPRPRFFRQQKSAWSPLYKFYWSSKTVRWSICSVRMSDFETFRPWITCKNDVKGQLAGTKLFQETFSKKGLSWFEPEPTWFIEFTEFREALSLFALADPVLQPNFICLISFLI